MSAPGQGDLFDNWSPADAWDHDATRRSLDELFSLARQYTSTAAYWDLLRFIGRFRFYSPFNAMLVHIQMEGAKFVAPPYRWLGQYRRRIRTGARPLVILRPMGPVMFVFDVSQTEPEGDEPPALPPEVEHPFEVRGGQIGGELSQTIENAKRDGISVTESDAGSQSAGMIRTAEPGRQLRILAKIQPEPAYVSVPLRYELLLNAKHSAEAKYATLVHELGHLYCGHLGTPNDRWWPDRRGLKDEICEFEAESVSYLVCRRLGIDSPSETYLANYVNDQSETPPISLDRVLTSAGLIEQMGRERLSPRKEKGSG